MYPIRDGVDYAPWKLFDISQTIIIMLEMQYADGGIIVYISEISYFLISTLILSRI